MNIFRRTWRAIRSTLSEPSKWMVDLLSGGRVASGAIVNERTAMTYTAFWACVRAIAKPVASLPLHLYERTDEGRRRAADHPLYRLLNSKPNPEMTALSFRDVMTSHLLTWGNAYAEIQYGPNGYPVALWPITPNRVKVERAETERRIRYRVSLPNGGEALLRDKDH